MKQKKASLKLVDSNDEEYFWIEREVLNAEPAFKKLDFEAGIHNKYWLFTRKHMKTPQQLIENDTLSVQHSNYKANKPTYVIVHGWLNDENSDVNTIVKSALLEVQDCNVIILDWSPVAKTYNYNSASRGVVGVGEYLGRFLSWLIKTTRGDWKQVHLIGHSLGAHVVGNAGRQTGGRPGRITGLDPALPLWSNSKYALDSTCGQYVEAIHTNGGMLGIFKPIAHADFYPNGGYSQPGCKTSSCSHSMAYRLFASSIREPNRFHARHCENLKMVQKAECHGNVLYMGNTDMKKKGFGVYGLKTKKDWPY